MLRAAARIGRVAAVGMRALSVLSVPPSGSVHRAERLVFVSGPFTHVAMWRDILDECASRGFESSVVSFSGRKDIEDMANGVR